MLGWKGRGSFVPWPLLLLALGPRAAASQLQTLPPDSIPNFSHAVEVARNDARGTSHARWSQRKTDHVAAGKAGLRLERSPAAFQPSGECSTTISATFYLMNDSLSFTMGRSPEECNEVPRLIWNDHGTRRADPLPALYDYNVSAAWWSGHYIVLALEADYELGSHAERLAFWDLDAGHIVSSPKFTGRLRSGIRDSRSRSSAPCPTGVKQSSSTQVTLSFSEMARSVSKCGPPAWNSRCSTNDSSRDELEVNLPRGKLKHGDRGWPSRRRAWLRLRMREEKVVQPLVELLREFVPTQRITTGEP